MVSKFRCQIDVKTLRINESKKNKIKLNTYKAKKVIKMNVYII